MPELLADLNTGHNIIATVFEECRSMYRAAGPVGMRPVGEVEFVAGIAAMSASGDYGPIKVAQGIVGFADLALGDRVEPALEALIRAGGNRGPGDQGRCGHGPRVQPGFFCWASHSMEPGAYVGSGRPEVAWRSARSSSACRRASS